MYGLHENSSDHLTILEPTQERVERGDDSDEPGRGDEPAGRGDAEPLAVLGRRDHLEHRRSAATATRWIRRGACGTRRARAPPNETPALLQRRIGQSVGEAVSDCGGGRGGGRQYTVYDPKTKKIDIVDTCFSTFHLNFDDDANNTIWSGGGGLVGWVNTKVLDETHDAGKAQGWTELIVDTNGNGKRDALRRASRNRSIRPRTRGSAAASTP